MYYEKRTKQTTRPNLTLRTQFKIIRIHYRYN